MLDLLVSLNFIILGKAYDDNGDVYSAACSQIVFIQNRAIR